MKKTKQKIILSSIELFNQKGLTNVRLQNIADQCGISVGNLAYHFPNKLAIIEVIDEILQSEIEPILSDKKRFPYLIDFDNQLSNYYFFINKYAFYFLDLMELERSYPDLHIKRKQYIHKMIDQIHKWLLDNISKSILQEEIQEEQYRHTAKAIWMIITFWMTQQHVKGTHHQDEGEFKEVVWNQLVPIFTESGLMEFEAIILPQLKIILPNN
jgi:AcrR family transcriptional regulator